MAVPKVDLTVYDWPPVGQVEEITDNQKYTDDSNTTSHHPMFHIPLSKGKIRNWFDFFFFFNF